jgi:CDP-glucose 4,6-dehydratase
MNVFLTGHTGFKGAWMVLYLKSLGHKVHGYSNLVDPNSLFSLGNFEALCDSHNIGDVRNLRFLTATLAKARPDVVIHFAAQSLVLQSYRDPANTFETNINGTLNTLIAASSVDSVKKTLIITTDKVYRNDGRLEGYKEDDDLGGTDPYSKSKSIADQMSQFWSAMNPREDIAIARAGNVIGGGDIGKERLMPELIAGFATGRPVKLRNPLALRPWQYVLDCLSGYLCLIDRPKILGHENIWNFGPNEEDRYSVLDLYNETASYFNNISHDPKTNSSKFFEPQNLTLDSTKARSLLKWKNRFDFKETVHQTVKWYKDLHSGKDILAISNYSLEFFLQKS